MTTVDMDSAADREPEYKVLHVTHTDLAGGRFNGLMLNRHLPALGVYSEQVVWEMKGHDPKTWPFFCKNRYFLLNRLVQFFEHALSIQSLFYFASWRLLFDRRVRRMDLLHLHLIHNQYFSLLTLPFLTRMKPTVWTIHDPWAMTGRCIYQLGCEGWKTGCGICPDLKTHFSEKRDRSAFMWKVKNFIYRLSKFELIVASDYMHRMVQQSPLLKRFPTHVVPFGVDVAKFKPGNKKEAQDRLGVFPGSRVISFRVNAGYNKGTEYLLQALRDLSFPEKICLISVDTRGMLDEFRGKFQIIDMGWIKNENDLVDVYNASDVFLMPSVAEAFGVMAIEAMACGTPIVVAEGTALPQVVEAPRGGMLIKSHSSSAILNAILKILTDAKFAEELGKQARQIAVKKYSLDRHLRTMKAVYDGVLKRRHT